MLMRRVPALVALLFVLVLAGGLPADGWSRPAAGVPARDVGLLVGIRAAHHPGYDRIVFQFEGPLPTTHDVSWRDELWYDSAGPDRRAWVAGNAFLRVLFSPAQGMTDNSCCDSSYGPTDRAYDLPGIVEVMEIGNWEGYLSFGIGLMERTSVLRTMTLTSPTRFAIDIATDHRQRGVDVSFFDSMHDQWSTVARVVPATGSLRADARNALHRLFAGPTLAEQAAGLRFISSGANRFSDLRISADGIARVTVKGGCQPSPTGRSLGMEIIRTLKALKGIDHVKNGQGEGSTLRPYGHSNSIPACMVS